MSFNSESNCMICDQPDCPGPHMHPLTDLEREQSETEQPTTKLGVRLPSEAELDYLCTNGQYDFGTYRNCVIDLIRAYREVLRVGQEMRNRLEYLSEVYLTEINDCDLGLVREEQDEWDALVNWG